MRLKAQTYIPSFNACRPATRTQTVSTDFTMATPNESLPTVTLGGGEDGQFSSRFIRNITGLAQSNLTYSRQSITICPVGIYHLDLIFMGFFPALKMRNNLNNLSNGKQK